MKTLKVITRSTPMCGGCMGLKLGLEAEKIPFKEIDIAHEPDAVETYGITSVPVSIIEDSEGNEVFRINGIRSPEFISEMLK